MQTIDDPRLPFTTSLPDGVSLEAVVSNKSALLAGCFSDAREAELHAVRSQTEAATLNTTQGIAYVNKAGGPSVSSLVGFPVETAPSAPSAEVAK